jgi:hypothetical protein
MGSDPCQPSRRHYGATLELEKRPLATDGRGSKTPSNRPDLNLNRTPELKRDGPEADLEI